MDFSVPVLTTATCPAKKDPIYDIKYDMNQVK